MVMNARGIVRGLRRQQTNAERKAQLVELNARFASQLKGAEIAHVYSARSRVMRSTPTMTAVKLRTGEQAWIGERGMVNLSEMRDMLYCVDRTMMAAEFDISLLDIFDNTAPVEQMRFIEDLQGFDWTEFWEEAGSDQDNLQDREDAYLGLLERLGVDSGWDEEF